MRSTDFSVSSKDSFGAILPTNLFNIALNVENAVAEVLAFIAEFCAAVAASPSKSFLLFASSIFFCAISFFLSAAS